MLIELVTVVVLIALLLGIVLPALTSSRRRGQRVVCQSNLRQNAMAGQVFTQNNNDRFPFGFCHIGGFSSAPPGGFVGDAALDWQGWWWFHQVSDSRNPAEEASLSCPSALPTDNLLCGNYGVNYAIYKIGSADEETEFKGTPLKTSQLKQPARTVLLCDSGYGLISWKAALPTGRPDFENPQRLGSYYVPGLTDNSRRGIDPAQLHDAVRGRHTGHSINAAFADGHVRSLKASLLTAGDPNDGRPNRLYIWSP